MIVKDWLVAPITRTAFLQHVMSECCELLIVWTVATEWRDTDGGFVGEPTTNSA